MVLRTVEGSALVADFAAPDTAASEAYVDVRVSFLLVIFLLGGDLENVVVAGLIVVNGTGKERMLGDIVDWRGANADT